MFTNSYQTQSTMAQGSTSPMSQFASIMKMAKSSPNPQIIIENAAKQNPALKQTMDELNKCSNPKAAFYAKAKEKGMSDEDISNFLEQAKTTFNSFAI